MKYLRERFDLIKPSRINTWKSLPLCTARALVIRYRARVVPCDTEGEPCAKTAKAISRIRLDCGEDFYRFSLMIEGDIKG